MQMDVPTAGYYQEYFVPATGPYPDNYPAQYYADPYMVYSQANTIQPSMLHPTPPVQYCCEYPYMASPSGYTIQPTMLYPAPQEVQYGFYPDPYVGYHQDYSVQPVEWSSMYHEPIPGYVPAPCEGMSYYHPYYHGEAGTSEATVPSLLEESRMVQETEISQSDQATFHFPVVEENEDLLTDTSNTDEDLLQNTRRILGRVTQLTDRDLMEQLAELSIVTEEQLSCVVDQVYEQALIEPRCSAAYARFCSFLAKLQVPLMNEPSMGNFEALLLSRCKREFEMVNDTNILAASSTGDMKNKTRNRSINNITFLGELYKLQVVPLIVMHECVSKLLRTTDYWSVKCICSLLTIIGKDLEREKEQLMSLEDSSIVLISEEYVTQIKRKIKHENTSLASRLMLKGILRLWLNNWESPKHDLSATRVRPETEQVPDKPGGMKINPQSVLQFIPRPVESQMLAAKRNKQLEASPSNTENGSIILDPVVNESQLKESANTCQPQERTEDPERQKNEEAFEAARDIHGLFALSKKPTKTQRMANHYYNLSTGFWKSGNALFHACALHRLYRLSRKMRKKFSQGEMQRISTRVLLATLSIPITPERTDIARLVDMEGIVVEKHLRLATLLDLDSPPTRQSLINDMVQFNVLQYVVPEVKELYNWLEVDFHPLKLCGRVTEVLNWVRDQAEKGSDLNEYVPYLQDNTILRMLQQVAQIYQNIEFSRLLSLVPFVDALQLERYIVDAARHCDLQVRIDHSSRTLRFGSDLNYLTKEDMLSEQIKNQLTAMSSSLAKAIQVIKPASIPQERDEQYQQAIAAYLKNAHKEHQRILARRQAIEDRLEQKEEEELEQREAKLQNMLKAEEERLRQEAKEREKALIIQEHERNKKKIVRDRLEQIKKTELGAKAFKNIDIEDLEELDIDLIMAKQVEKENKKLQERLKNQEKKMNCFERAKRLEEIPLIKKAHEEQHIKDMELWELQEEERINKEREKALERKQGMMEDIEIFLSKIKAARSVIYEEKLKQFQERFVEEKKKRLEERKKQRKEERRKAFYRQKEEEAQRIREEQLKKERDERERLEQEQREKEEREYQERLRKLEEEERKQLAQQQEIEERERCKEEEKRTPEEEPSKDWSEKEEGGWMRRGEGKSEWQGPVADSDCCQKGCEGNEPDDCDRELPFRTEGDSSRHGGSDDTGLRPGFGGHLGGAEDSGPRRGFDDDCGPRQGFDNDHGHMINEEDHGLRRGFDEDRGPGQGDDDHGPNKGFDEDRGPGQGDDDHGPSKGFDEDRGPGQGDDDHGPNKGFDEDRGPGQGDDDHGPIKGFDEDRGPGQGDDDHGPSKGFDEDRGPGQGDDDHGPNKGFDEDRGPGQGDDDHGPSKGFDEDRGPGQGDDDHGPNKGFDEDRGPGQGDDDHGPNKGFDEDRGPGQGDDDHGPSKGFDEDRGPGQGDDDHGPNKGFDEDRVPRHGMEDSKGPRRGADDDLGPRKRGDDERGSHRGMEDSGPRGGDDSRPGVSNSFLGEGWIRRNVTMCGLNLFLLFVKTAVHQIID